MTKKREFNKCLKRTRKCGEKRHGEEMGAEESYKNPDKTSFVIKTDGVKINCPLSLILGIIHSRVVWRYLTGWGHTP